jgi:flagellar export protein FliJ
MKTFAWRLQRVLDVKGKEEQLKQTELFRLTEALAAKRGELLVRQRALRDLMTEIGTGRTAGRVRSQEFFLRHAVGDDDHIRRLQQEIASLEAQRNDKTAEFLAVRRFKEGLEKLRAQAYEEFLREQDRFEQRELDDKSTIRFARRDTADGTSEAPRPTTRCRNGLDVRGIQ